MKNKLNFGQEKSQENRVIVIPASVTLNKSFVKQLELSLLDASEKVARWNSKFRRLTIKLHRFLLIFRTFSEMHY